MIYPFNKKLRSNPRVRLYAGEYLLDQFAAYEQAIKRYAQQQLQQFFPIEEQEGEQT